MDSEFTDISYHTEVHWLSRGKVLNRVFERHKEICQVMDSKGKDSNVLRDEKQKCELAFLTDITTHVNVLYRQLQGRDRMITDMYDAMKAFQEKLLLWETQMPQCNLPQFTCCEAMLNQVSATIFPYAHFADKLSGIRTEFLQHLDTLKHKKACSQL